ncbi:hypothetical protein PR048_028712 [Dryococelus australis]|uniref:Uncharacterized protein n=1 Tax=Dryococelus australis TaxID=614101 RepID=A0ABQ9GC01_9NEOP|nr:hypothetical protein PR048_028712 [Dryococelus australis]
MFACRPVQRRFVLVATSLRQQSNALFALFLLAARGQQQARLDSLLYTRDIIVCLLVDVIKRVLRTGLLNTHTHHCFLLYYWLTVKRGVSKELSSNHNSGRKEQVFGVYLAPRMNSRNTRGSTNRILTEDSLRESNEHLKIRFQIANPLQTYSNQSWGRGVTERLACSPLTQGEPGSIPGRATPGFSQVGSVPDDADWTASFLGDPPFTHLFIPELLHFLLNQPHRLSRPRSSLFGESGRGSLLDRHLSATPLAIPSCSAGAWNGSYRTKHSVTLATSALCGFLVGSCVLRPITLKPLASHQGDQGSIPGRTCRTMPLVAGFSRGSPVSPALSFRCRSILTSITHVGSQDHAVNSRPNLFSSLHSLNRTDGGVSNGLKAGTASILQHRNCAPMSKAVHGTFSSWLGALCLLSWSHTAFSVKPASSPIGYVLTLNIKAFTRALSSRAMLLLSTPHSATLDSVLIKSFLLELCTPFGGLPGRPATFTHYFHNRVRGCSAVTINANSGADISSLTDGLKKKRRRSGGQRQNLWDGKKYADGGGDLQFQRLSRDGIVLQFLRVRNLDLHSDPAMNTLSPKRRSPPREADRVRFLTGSHGMSAFEKRGGRCCWPDGFSQCARDSTSSFIPLAAPYPFYWRSRPRCLVSGHVLFFWQLPYQVSSPGNRVAVSERRASPRGYYLERVDEETEKDASILILHSGQVAASPVNMQILGAHRPASHQQLQMTVLQLCLQEITFRAIIVQAGHQITDHMGCMQRDAVSGYSVSPCCHPFVSCIRQITSKYSEIFQLQPRENVEDFAVDQWGFLRLLSFSSRHNILSVAAPYSSRSILIDTQDPSSKAPPKFSLTLFRVGKAKSRLQKKCEVTVNGLHTHHDENIALQFRGPERANDGALGLKVGGPRQMYVEIFLLKEQNEVRMEQRRNARAGKREKQYCRKPNERKPLASRKSGGNTNEQYRKHEHNRKMNKLETRKRYVFTADKIYLVTAITIRVRRIALKSCSRRVQSRGNGTCDENTTNVKLVYAILNRPIANFPPRRRLAETSWTGLSYNYLVAPGIRRALNADSETSPQHHTLANPISDRVSNHDGATGHERAIQSKSEVGSIKVRAKQGQRSPLLSVTRELWLQRRRPGKTIDAYFRTGRPSVPDTESQYLRKRWMKLESGRLEYQDVSIRRQTGLATAIHDDTEMLVTIGTHAFLAVFNVASHALGVSASWWPADKSPNGGGYKLDSNAIKVLILYVCIDHKQKRSEGRADTCKRTAVVHAC